VRFEVLTAMRLTAFSSVLWRRLDSGRYQGLAQTYILGLQRRRWRQYVLPNRQYIPTGKKGATAQKINVVRNTASFPKRYYTKRKHGGTAQFDFFRYND
jgi:hypothetical protein